MKYYNPHNIDEHVPDVDGIQRDELGLVCTICMKVHMQLQSQTSKANWFLFQFLFGSQAIF